MSKTILVYSPIYNEARYLDRLISSVLDQTLNNFTFLVSDNHSTDKSRDILNSFAGDERLRLISPPTHLSGLNHYRWLTSYISHEFSDIEFSAFVGGHDIWQENYLETLYKHMLANENCILAYSDTYEISADNIILQKYPINVSTENIIIPLRPLYILNGLTHDIAFGGLWRENVRRLATSNDIVCAASDHLQLARASLYGDISYVHGTSMRLRQVEGAGSLAVYYQKHLQLEKNETLKGVADFKKQLRNAVEIQIESVKGFPFFEHKAMLNSMINSMFTTYVARYIGLLTFFDNGPDFFFSDKEIKSFLKANENAALNISSFLTSS